MSQNVFSELEKELDTYKRFIGLLTNSPTNSYRLIKVNDIGPLALKAINELFNLPDYRDLNVHYNYVRFGSLTYIILYFPLSAPSSFSPKDLYEKVNQTLSSKYIQLLEVPSASEVKVFLEKGFFYVNDADILQTPGILPSNNYSAIKNITPESNNKGLVVSPQKYTRYSLLLGQSGKPFSAAIAQDMNDFIINAVNIHFPSCWATSINKKFYSYVIIYVPSSYSEAMYQAITKLMSLKYTTIFMEDKSSINISARRKDMKLDLANMDEFLQPLCDKRHSQEAKEKEFFAQKSVKPNEDLKFPKSPKPESPKRTTFKKGSYEQKDPPHEFSAPKSHPWDEDTEEDKLTPWELAQKEDKENEKLANYIAIAIGVVVMAVFLYFVLGPSKPSKEKKPAPTTQTQTVTYTKYGDKLLECEDAINAVFSNNMYSPVYAGCKWAKPDTLIMYVNNGWALLPEAQKKDFVKKTAEIWTGVTNARGIHVEQANFEVRVRYYGTERDIAKWGSVMGPRILEN